MDLDELLESIAEKAPSMRINDTVHAAPGVWWKVVGDEKTRDRQMVESDLLHATSTTAATWNAVEFWYGTALSVWGLLVGIVVVLGLLYRRRSAASHQLPLMLFKPRASNRKWFVVNLVVLQLITAVTILVTPATVTQLNDEKRSASPSPVWGLGPEACHAWLLGRMWLAAATMWAAFAALFDRFLSAVAPAPYGRLVGSGAGDPSYKSPGGCDGDRGRSRAGVLIALGVVATWLAAATVLIPTWLSLDRSDFVLDEVCAINLSSVNALYVTMSSYVVPSSLVIVVSLALVIARRRAKRSSSNDAECVCADNYTRLGGGFAGFPATELHDYDVIPDRTINGHRNETGFGATCAASWLCVLGWLPFHSVGIAVALCGILTHGVTVDLDDSSSPSSISRQAMADTETPMCVDPGVWTLFNWIGHSATIGLIPVVWLVGDRALRTRLLRFFAPSCCVTHPGSISSSAGGRSSASSTCATDLSSSESRRRLDAGSTL